MLLILLNHMRDSALHGLRRLEIAGNANDGLVVLPATATTRFRLLRDLHLRAGETLQFTHLQTPM